MIYDQLKNASIYTGISENIASAMNFLKSTDFSQLSDGRYSIDGENVYALIMTYQTRLPEDTFLEAHQRFIDIQYMLEGEEQFFVGFLDEMDVLVEQRPADDIAFFKGLNQPLRLGHGRFLMLFPEDAHAPSVCIGEPRTVRKVVVKVQVENQPQQA